MGGETISDLIKLLDYLLPGFLAAWVFYGITSFPKPAQFERVVQAMVFTLIIRAGVYSIEALLLLIGKAIAFGPWSEKSSMIASVTLAIPLGVALGYCANNDVLHSFLRKYNVTRETSHPSTWFAAFCNAKTYVVLHLADERRIYGWPRDWPSDATNGHFALQKAKWLVATKKHPGQEIYEMTGVDAVLVKAADVVLVEFLESETFSENEQKAKQLPAPSAHEASER
jgi:hypothetical protein